MAAAALGASVLWSHAEATQTDSPTHSQKPTQGVSIEERIAAVRMRIAEIDADEGVVSRGETFAQWFNWPNWPNYWNNWQNLWRNF